VVSRAESGYRDPVSRLSRSVTARPENGGRDADRTSWRASFIPVARVVVVGDEMKVHVSGCIGTEQTFDVVGVAVRDNRHAKYVTFVRAWDFTSLSSIRRGR
jgi:hypothetical protein